MSSITQIQVQSLFYCHFPVPFPSNFRRYFTQVVFISGTLGDISDRLYLISQKSAQHFYESLIRTETCSSSMRRLCFCPWGLTAGGGSAIVGATRRLASAKSGARYFRPRGWIRLGKLAIAHDRMASTTNVNGGN